MERKSAIDLGDFCWDAPNSGVTTSKLSPPSQHQHEMSPHDVQTHDGCFIVTRIIVILVCGCAF